MCTGKARANIHCHADSCSLFLPEAKQWYILMVSFVSSCPTYTHERIVGVFYHRTEKIWNNRQKLCRNQHILPLVGIKNFRTTKQAWGQLMSWRYRQKCCPKFSWEKLVDITKILAVMSAPSVRVFSPVF